MSEKCIRGGIGVMVAYSSVLQVCIPARGADSTPLRRNDDDTVCRIGPVKRRCRRSFDYLEIFDLIGVDVAQPARVRSANSDAGRTCRALHADAVDYHDRIITERQAVHTANP